MIGAMRVSRRELTDMSRSAGGLLLATGAVVLLIRKSAHHEWSGLARLLVVLVPAAVLYMLAVGVSEGAEGRRSSVAVGADGALDPAHPARAV